MNRWISQIKLGGLWNKYGLIVVGNIVFFILLYFISYRPQNTDNRSMELLSMAQSAETNGHHETAADLYEKILTDYRGTRAAQTAGDRLPSLKKRLSVNRVVPQDCPARCEDLNLEEMLRKEPSVYIATHMAKHYDRYPSDRSKIREIILKNLKAAYEWANVPMDKLKGETEFQTPDLQHAFFDLQPRCLVTPDWIYDDFAVRNDNFFSWKNAVIQLTVSQGEAKMNKLVRAPEAASAQAVDILEFRIKKNAGPVNCKITVKSDQGQISVSQDI
jgi:hypothetical protein